MSDPERPPPPPAHPLPVASALTPALEWIDPEAGAAWGACLVVHGMNTRTAAMAGYGSLLRRAGLAEVRLRLSGHDVEARQPHGASQARWLAEGREAVAELRRRLEGRPLLGLGYSLGGALLVALADEGVAWEGLVLVAPAIRLRPVAQLLRPASRWHGRRLTVPSRTPQQYRAFGRTSLDTYRALYDLVDSLHTLRSPARVGAISTLVLASPRDELVHPGRLEQWMARHQLQRWRLVPIQTVAWHHVILDPFSATPEAWHRIESEVEGFLSKRRGERP